MKTAKKVWLIVAGALVLLGALLFVGVLALNHWDLSRFGAGYETRTVEIREDFDRISLRVDSEDIRFAVSEDGICRVAFYEKEDAAHTAAVLDHTLSIEQADSGNWFDSFSLFRFDSPRITVYLPQTEYAALRIDAGTGDIEIPADFRFGQLDVKVSTGDVTCRASASGSMKLEASTGKIRVENASAGELALSVSTGRAELCSVDCAGALDVHVTTGDASLTDVRCRSLASTGSTGDLTLDRVIAAQTLTVERSTGDVKLTACDAGELAIQTTTGDVTGSLLSGKVFIVKSDTGDVSVPETITGGKCKITTHTGDIKITIAP